MANPLVASLGLTGQTEPKIGRAMIMALLLQLLADTPEDEEETQNVHEQPEVPVRPRVEPLGG